MIKHLRPTYGFTIVELLVVIVIIGILATIATNVFGGIQKRAQDANALAMANQWEKILLSYTSLKGEYPNDLGFNTDFCLGALPADGYFSEGECSKATSGANSSTRLKPLIEDAGLPYPSGVTNTIRPTDNGLYDSRGVTVRVLGTRKSAEIRYFLSSGVCQPGESVGWQSTLNRTTVGGAAAPGRPGLEKVCLRKLPDH